MANKTSRRNFLRTAPVAAAAGFTLAESLAAMGQLSPKGANAMAKAKREYMEAMAQAAASTVKQGADVNAAAQPFKLWTSKELDADRAALDAKPGDNRLHPETAGAPMQIVLTTEKHKSAPEFEWHEGRDHIVQILDGSTLYEVGGTPTGSKVMPGTGEWHATAATGSKSILMVKGDMLLIPRGTLHKRSTEDSVTFLLISNPVPAKT